MPLFSDLLNLVNRPSNPETREPFVRDSRTAARFFGLKDSALDRIPRHKFLFYVNFLRPTVTGGTTRYGDWTTGISFLVKSVNRPSINLKTETLNQYNKKRVVQGQLEYAPVNIQFYDTYDLRVLQMFKEYMTFYYGDFKATNRLSWNADIVTKDFQYVATTEDGTFPIDWGFNAPNTGPNESYFFHAIEVYQFGMGKYNKFTLVHPKISNFSYDQEDYSDNAGPQMIDMQFVYEGLILDSVNRDITPGLAEYFGLDLGDFNDVAFPGYVRQPSIDEDLRRANDFGRNVNTVGTASPSQPTNPTPQTNADNTNPSLISSVRSFLPSWNSGGNFGAPTGFNPNAPSPGSNDLVGRTTAGLTPEQVQARNAQAKSAIPTNTTGLTPQQQSLREGARQESAYVNAKIASGSSTASTGVAQPKPQSSTPSLLNRLGSLFG